MKYLIIPILIFICTAIFAQEDETYNIIRLNGQIHNVTAGEDLNQGNSFNSDDELNFVNAQSSGIVISNLRKKYSLKMPGEDAVSSAALALNPILSRGQFSTRGLVGPYGVKDLKEYLSEENFNVIGNSIDIHLNKNTYPLNEDQFIVILYKIGEKDVSKKLGFENQHINIDKDKLSKSGDLILDSDTIQQVEIIKYTNSTKEKETVTKVNICFIEKEALKKEFEAIVSILNTQDSDTEEMRQYLFEYFFDVYGNVDETQLNSFIIRILNSQ